MHRTRPWLVAAAATLALPAAASAATPAQIDTASSSAATWIAARQDPSTGSLGGQFDFGSDWALTGLAATGRHAADVQTGGSPSAQDFYLGDWTSPSWTGTIDPQLGYNDGFKVDSDMSRAALLAHAAGLQPTRLSARQNLTAQLASVYHPRPATPDAPDAAPTEGSIGDPGLYNHSVFALLALLRADGPKPVLDKLVGVVRANQHDDGGWQFTRVLSAANRAQTGDIDMTGASIAALCDAGVPASDAAVQRGVSFLAGRIDAATGAFNAAFGANADSNAWAVQGLKACGIDPQGARFTTAQGKTPVDFLLSLQRTTGAEAGSFKYQPAEADTDPPNLYATQDALRALAGRSFTAEPPARAGGAARVRPAPAVPAGTTVPQALAIDAGVDATGERDVRFCRVDVPNEAPLTLVLQIAAAGAQPAGCVQGLQVGDGRVQALNGVAENGDARWRVALGGGASEAAASQPVGLGQVVTLTAPTRGGTSSPAPAPQAPPAPAPAAQTARATTASVAATRQRIDARGRIAARVTCPVQAGTDGCFVVVKANATIRATRKGKARSRRVGIESASVRPGTTRTIRVTLSRALRQDLRHSGRRQVRLYTGGRTTAAPLAPSTTRVTVARPR